MFKRLQDPAVYTYVSLADGQEIAQGPELLIRLLSPAVLAFVFALAVFIGASQMSSAIIREKESRAMEMIIASLRPRELLAAKLLGLGALTLVQNVVWAALGLAILFVTSQGLSSLTEAVNFSAGELVLVVFYGLGDYCLYAGLLAGIGALSPDLESSRTWTFVITLPMLIPLYLWVVITSAPQGVLAVTLSFIPFSSPLAMLMRMASTTVPFWQVSTSLALLLLAAAGIVWLMARLFRVQTLLSGEAFSPGRFWRVSNCTLSCSGLACSR